MVTWSALVRRAGCAVMLLCAWSPVAVAEASEVVDFRVAGRSFEADLFGPPAAPRGTVVLSHGFLRDRQSLARSPANWLIAAPWFLSPTCRSSPIPSPTPPPSRRS